MAESFFRRVRKLDASNHEMVEFYREYYTAKNEPPQLLTVLAQAQKTEGDVERRVAMGIEMARAAEKRPQHAEKAIEIWKGILRLKPHLPEAVTSLRALYTRTEKWNALLELLKDDLDAVPAADVDEKINRYLEIVAIYRDRLNLDVMVVNTYLNILALKPDHPAALAALASRYEAQGRYGDLGPGADPAGRGGQGSGRRASRCTGASPRCGPTSWASTATRSPASRRSSRPIRPTAETSARLKDLYTKGRAWRPLIEVYRKELPHLDAAARRARLIEMARVAADRLNDVREAISLYNQVLAVEERDADALTGPGDAVRSRAALAGADRGARAAAAERGRAERRRRRAGAARTARRAALRPAGRDAGGDRGLQAHPGAAAQERARGAGAARDLRAGGRLHGAGSRCTPSTGRSAICATS